MAAPNGASPYPDEKRPRRSGKSPARATNPNGNSKPWSSTSDYTSEGIKDNDVFQLPGSDWQILSLLTVLALVVRLFRIFQPSSVVFDEVHFGGFASKYIKGKFFMDVHPPLAKMLIALAGYLAGFDGEFDFKDIGKDYVEPGVPYVAMRLFPALCGVMTIPTIFLTLKATGCRTTTAALGACLIIFENGLLTNNRLILLDSPLVTATACTALGWTCFTNQQEQGPSKAFKPAWWFWLISTGLCLGATASIKWVGLFTIAWVGSLTVLQMWVLLGDANTVTPRLFSKHLLARVFCLIVIPIGFYMAMFAIHFLCLVNPGEGDGFMSSEFQATLNSKGMESVPADVSFGSRISLRHHNTQGGYLHSHLHMYPEGSKQQQITLYPHKDHNNVWIMENQTAPVALEPITGPLAWDNMKPIHIMDGAVIKIYHQVTDRRLHSHDVRPPVTEADWQNEVSAYGYDGFEGDANDLFKVEIIKSMSDGEEAKKRLRTIQTKFRLAHVMSGCLLFSHKVKLPDWGFEQQEVTCAKGGTLPNSVWYIEENDHPNLPADAEKVNYRDPGFLGKFWELQRVMWQTNAGLTDSHAWDSRPPSWPILARGINFWGYEKRQIYLIGNPVIWLSSTLAVTIYIATKGVSIIRWQRGYKDYEMLQFKRFDYEVGTMVLGWGFHYFPFYLMSRQLFLHHYFPALYFAIIALCQIYEFFYFRFSFFGLRNRPAVGQAIAIAFLAASITAFTLFAPIAYGNQWTRGSCNKVKLFESWDWDCNQFPDNYSEYASIVSRASGAVTSSAAPNLPVYDDQDEGYDAPPVPDAAYDFQVTDKASGVPFDAAGNPVIGREERVEYRDEHGNLLSPEEVAALEGKVSFQTRYETRTKILDRDGKQVEEIVVEGQGNEQVNAQQVRRVHESVAPPHPDVEGRNPETKSTASLSVGDLPPTVDAEEDVAKEKTAIAQEKESEQAKPVGEREEATAA